MGGGRSFRFGDGKLMPSRGTVAIQLYLNHATANRTIPCCISVTADVVASLAPLLISRRSLAAMRCRLDFQHSALEIDNDLIIYLKHLPIGHISIPALPPRHVRYAQNGRKSLEYMGNYPTNVPPSLQPIAYAQVLKIHRHLSRCSGFAMANMLKASSRTVGEAQIRRVIRGCLCKGVVGRITPPKIPGWMERFNGEIVGIDVLLSICWGDGRNHGVNYLSLLMVDCVTRFAICSLVVDTKAATLISILLNDWIRPLGNPWRIITDAWPTGMIGTDWGEFSHAYVIQLILAPRSAACQNGLAERV